VKRRLGIDPNWRMVAPRFGKDVDRHVCAYRDPEQAAAAALVELRQGSVLGGLRVLNDLYSDAARFLDTMTALWTLTLRACRSCGGVVVLPPRPGLSDVDAYVAAALPRTDPEARARLVAYARTERWRHPRAMAITLFQCAQRDDRHGFRHLASAGTSADDPVTARRFFTLVLVEYTALLAAHLHRQEPGADIGADEVARLVRQLEPRAPFAPYGLLFDVDWQSPAPLPHRSVAKSAEVVGAERGVRRVTAALLAARRGNRIATQALARFQQGHLVEGIRVLLGRGRPDLMRELVFALHLLLTTSNATRVRDAVPLITNADLDAYLSTVLAGFPYETATQIRDLGTHPRAYAIELFNAAAAGDPRAVLALFHRLFSGTSSATAGTSGKDATIVVTTTSDVGYPQMRCLLLVVIELAFLVAANAGNCLRHNDQAVRDVLDELAIARFYREEDPRHYDHAIGKDW
jgi:hypothetical protein